MHSVSCITVCRNNIEGLKKTIDSVLTQSLYELVIIDGASTDGTAEELPQIKTYVESKGIQCVAISEPDTGIYNAMNKGIRYASGEWIIFMNAGDTFISDRDVLNAMYSESTVWKADVIYCDYILDNGKTQVRRKALPLSKMSKGMVTCHQAFLTKRERLLERNYQEKYRICADYEWYLDCYQKGRAFSYFAQEICVYDGTGVSMLNTVDTYKEVSAMRKEKGAGDSNIVVFAKTPVVWLYGKLLRMRIRHE